jgi:hypothetical protein
MLKTNFPNAWIGVILTGTIFILMACMLTFPSTEPVVEPIVPLTPTEVPLFARITLTSVPQHEDAQAPNYTIDIHTPVLEGSSDHRVEGFNELMHSIVQEELDGFKDWMAEMPTEPVTGGSFLGINFSQVSPPGDLISVKFTIAFYSDGAAHPGQYSRSVTYDLESGAEVSLAELFLPVADYLKVISTFCVSELRSRDIGFDDQWTSGANPTPENYRNWNVTADGLLITFDPYQVAAYAAGPQDVIISYAELATILNPNGPLAEIFP